MAETVQDVFNALLEEHRNTTYQVYGEGDSAFGASQLDEYVDGWASRFETALEAETEAQKSCPYCHDPSEDDPESNLSDVIGTRMQIQTDGVGTPYITTWDFNGSESKQIIFCPMCGRRLETSGE